METRQKDVIKGTMWKTAFRLGDLIVQIDNYQTMQIQSWRREASDGRKRRMPPTIVEN